MGQKKIRVNSSPPKANANKTSDHSTRRISFRVKFLIKFSNLTAEVIVVENFDEL